MILPHCVSTSIDLATPTKWEGSLPGVLSRVMVTGFPPSARFSRKKDNRIRSPFSSGAMLVRVMLGHASVTKKSQVLSGLTQRKCTSRSSLGSPHPCSDFGVWVTSILQLGPLYCATPRSPWKGGMRHRGNSLVLKYTVSDKHHFYFQFFAQLYSCGSQPNARRWGIVGEPTRIWGLLTISVREDPIQPHF